MRKATGVAAANSALLNGIELPRSISYLNDKAKEKTNQSVDGKSTIKPLFKRAAHY